MPFLTLIFSMKGMLIYKYEPLWQQIGVSFSDTQVTVKACGSLVRKKCVLLKLHYVILHGIGRCRGIYQINIRIFTDMKNRFKYSFLYSPIYHDMIIS